MTVEELPRILCVDDERRVLEGLERCLFSQFDVYAVDDAAKALELIAQDPHQFAVVVSDMRMPNIDGATFLARVRELAPDVTRILLTGHSEFDAAIRAVNDGHIFRFLSKPCAAEVLIAAIHSGVQQNRMVTAERQLLTQTLTGSVRMLTEVLGLVAPGLFNRAQRIRNFVLHMANQLSLPEAWRYELAASLCMIGCVGLPEETLSRVLAGQALSAEEKRSFAEYPLTTYRLLTGIPRIEDVAEMIRRQVPSKEPAPENPVVETGVALLRVARAADEIIETGTALPAALQRLSMMLESSFTPYLKALGTFHGTVDLVRELRINQMTAGMVLEEDARTTANVIVIPRGKELSQILIVRLLQFSRSGSLIEPIRVRVVH